MPRAEPEAVGLFSVRFTRILPALNAQIETGHLPGAVIAIARHGHLVFHEAVGHLGPDRSIPMPRDAPFAIASMTKPDTGVPQSVPDRTQKLRFECGGGGLASTALDYLHFAQMLLGGGILGETRIFGRKTVEAMRTNRLTPDIENRIAALDPHADGYGFGLTVAVRERAGTLMGSLGEFCWNGAWGTLWWADPVEDLAVVFMIQVPGEQSVRFRPLINSLVYGALTG